MNIDWALIDGGYYPAPHVVNGKTVMVGIKVRLAKRKGKAYPFSSEKQNARYRRQKRR